MPTGPSSSQSPYLVGLSPNISFTSIVTAGDVIGTKPDDSDYVFVGVPDGIGAFDNGDGTFTVLVNHEILAPAAAEIREHGAPGAFVSSLIIDKATLAVVDAFDLANATYRDADGDGVWTLEPVTFARLCSADLPPVGAFFDAGADGVAGTSDDLGTQERIYLTGEEIGAEGRAFGFVVSGAEARTAWELPALGKFSWENALASPNSGAKTVVVSTDDSTPGQVYLYVGDKQATGNTVEKAGLTNGVLYGIKADGIGNTLTNNSENLIETDNNPATVTPMSGTFQAVALGDASTLTGAQLETASDLAGVSEFFRPEDGAWDTVDPDRFYFVTTSQITGPSRLWALDFTDVNDPSLGGTFTMLLDGTEGQRMMDNITVDAEGLVHIQEDIGNNAQVGRVLVYDPTTDVLDVTAQFDPQRFLPPTQSPFTADEESSGIIDVTSILGDADTKAFLLDAQAHYLFQGPLASEVVEGGQLLVMYIDDYDPGLTGKKTDDVLIGGAPDETVTGRNGADTLLGSAGDDTILAGRGNDLVFGGNGRDLLVGGGGEDAFYYRDATDGGDTIRRFVAGEDKIAVSASGFGRGLVEGQALTSDQLIFGTSGGDLPGIGQFVYDNNAGVLTWDADGSSNVAQAIVIATFTGAVNLAVSDFVVFA